MNVYQKYRILLPSSFLTICVCLTPVPGRSQPPSSPEQKQIAALQQQISELKKSFDAFKADNIQLHESLSDVALSVLPVGSIVAFGGPIETISMLQDWRLCDGRTVSASEYPDLWQRIGTSWGGGNQNSFKLPDLRGLFLRGDDRGSGRDEGRRAGGTPGPGVGLVEDWATALPRKAFSADQNPASVEINFYPEYDGSNPPNYAGSSRPMVRPRNTRDTRPQDDGVINTKPHGHTISGGDGETRPTNASVNWLIRVK